MSKWSSEFLYDLPCSYSYYKEENPLYLKHLLTSKGFSFPDIENGNALEIGFGKGISISMHAATSTTKWMGTEFNPSLVNTAKRVAKECNIDAELTSESLEEFARRTDLPKFDLICLHGVWSWISDRDQESIIDIADRHLKDGGIFYVSYNCTVGMINFEPVRHLMHTYNQKMNPSNMADHERLNRVATYLLPIVRANPSFVVSQPDFAERITAALATNTNEFLSENLNTHWSMSHFSDISRRLERADLGFMCSALGNDNLDFANLTPEQIEFIEPLLGTVMYEDTRDFIVNQRFRHDIYVKGGIPLSPNEYLATFRSLNILMIDPADSFNYTITGRNGEVELDKAVYGPLIEILADNEPHNVGAILDIILSSNQELAFDQVANAINTLVYANICAPCVAAESVDEEKMDRCRRYNFNTIENYTDSPTVFMCSPLTQGGIAVDPLQVKLLGIYLQNPECHDLALVEAILTLCVAGEVNFNNDGQALSEDELINVVSNYVANFKAVMLPYYKKLMFF